MCTCMRVCVCAREREEDRTRTREQYNMTASPVSTCFFFFFKAVCMDEFLTNPRTSVFVCTLMARSVASASSLLSVNYIV